MIFRYLSGTIDLGLWYPKGTRIELTYYSDANFTGYNVNRKSTSRACHFLGLSLVSWFSKKQIQLFFQSPRLNISLPMVVMHKPFE